MTREMIDLGIPNLEPVAFVRKDPEKWGHVHDRLHATPFLKSEGLVFEVGAPQRAAAPLVADVRDLTARFAKFYANAVRTYFDRPELRPEFLFEPLLAPLLEIDATAPATTPLARLDIVLGTSGPMRVIEINPIGGTLIHLRALLYLVRGLARAGLETEAKQLDQLTSVVVDGFDRYYRLHHDRPAKRPTLGVLTPGFRATNMVFQGAFRRHGWEYVFGGAKDLQVDARGMTIKGVPIDMLWHDYLFIMAYQAARYRQTKWPSKVANYDNAPAQVEAMLGNPLFLEHLRTRRVVGVSPATAYLALSKSLLSWIHDPERPCPEEDRAWLAEHVARTFSARDRERGVLTLERALDERTQLLLKPCLYGGSHGVSVGRDTSVDDWGARLREIWSDPQWVLQTFHEPARTKDGQVLSVGAYSFEGALGGIYLRTAPSTIVSARTAAFIPVMFE